MMLAGSFLGDKEFSFEKRKGWVIFLTLVMFIAVLLIFLNALGWLDPIIEALSGASVIVPVVLILIILGTIFFVVGGKPKEDNKEWVTWPI